MSKSGLIRLTPRHLAWARDLAAQANAARPERVLPERCYYQGRAVASRIVAAALELGLTAVEAAMTRRREDPVTAWDKAQRANGKLQI